MIRIYLEAFTLALIISVLLTPVARRLGVMIGAVSIPGGRNVNAEPISRLGGLAIALGCAVPLIVLAFVEREAQSIMARRADLLLGAAMGATVMFVVGGLDDARGVRASFKLLAQCAAACIAFAAGFRIEALSLPLVGVLQMGAFSLPITILWLVGITNALNLIDGLDGLAGGVAFFAGITNLVVASISGSPFVALLMAAMLGAVLGFLFFNFNPARIYMGDSGSYLLGFLLACASLSGATQQKTSTAVALLVPMLALGLPIFDTLLSMVRRYLARRPIFSADRGHIHHRLLDLGLTHRRAVIVLYGVSVVLTAGAIGISLDQSWSVGLALVAVSMVLIGLIRYLGVFRVLRAGARREVRTYDERTDALRFALPSVLRGLETAADEATVLERIVQNAERLGMRFVVFRCDDNSVGWSWHNENAPRSARSVAESVFYLGHPAIARWKVCFGLWEDGDRQGNCDMLLQVMVDTLVERLRHVESDYVPAPAPAPVQQPPRQSVMRSRTLRTG